MRIILTAAERADLEALLAAYDAADEVCDANPSPEPWTPERKAAVAAWDVARDALDKQVSATFPFLGYLWDGVDAGEGLRAILAHAEVETDDAARIAYIAKQPNALLNDLPMVEMPEGEKHVYAPRVGLPDVQWQGIPRETITRYSVADLPVRHVMPGGGVITIAAQRRLQGVDAVEIIERGQTMWMQYVLTVLDKEATVSIALDCDQPRDGQSITLS